MSMLEFVEVKNEAGDERVARLAEWIWRDHYGAILGDGQIGYMLDKFQSAAAVGKQRSEGYRYFLVRDSGAPIGYFGAKPDGGKLFSVQTVLGQAGARQRRRQNVPIVHRGTGARGGVQGGDADRQQA